VAHFGPLEVVGNKSVGENIIRRQLTFKPGDLYRRSIVQDSQRRLYGLELFQFCPLVEWRARKNAVSGSP